MMLARPTLTPLALILGLGAAGHLTGCALPGQGAPPGEMAPTPFTAEELRDANPAGTRRVFRIEEPGKPARQRTMSFLAGDDGGCAIESRTTDLDGNPTEEPAYARASWENLRDHAAYPVEITTREEVTREVAAGTFDCWLYTVDGVDPDDGQRLSNRYWFAKSLPGPPVLLEMQKTGQVILSMELVEFSRP